MVSENTLVISIILAISGVFIIIMRKTERLGKENEFFLDSIEWLILGTAPLIPASELLPTHKEWGNLFIAVYVCIIVSWFVILWLTKKSHTKKANPIFLPVNILMFIGMIIFVIFTWQSTLV